MVRVITNLAAIAVVAFTGCGVESSNSPQLAEGDQGVQLESKQVDLSAQLKDLYRHMPEDLFDNRDLNRHNSSRRLAEIDTVLEFGEFYVNDCLNEQRDPLKINILYPGGGHDVMQLGIGLHLLHNSPVQQVVITYTEIATDLSWHQGFDDLVSHLQAKLKKYAEARLLRITSGPDNKIDYKNTMWGPLRRGIITFELEVSTAQQIKAMRLILHFNDFEHRPELTATEQECFNPEFVALVRNSPYWPVPGAMKEDMIYPKYATNELFDWSDIIISHRAGDPDLLHLDYLRALLQGQEHKQHVVFTEYLPGVPPPFKMDTELIVVGHRLENNYYGYVPEEGGHVIAWRIIRKKKEEDLVEERRTR